MSRHRIPWVVEGTFRPDDTVDTPSQAITVGSPAWFDWLHDEQHRSFSIRTDSGAITVRRERQRHGAYWYAYGRRAGRLHKAYLGKSIDLTAARLQVVTAALLTLAAGSVESPTLRFSLFGATRLMRDGRPVDLHAAKAIALLGYLAVGPAPPTRSQILSLLWPESTDEAARKNLRNALWAIRTALGAAVVQTGGRLRLDQRLWVDVHEFERLTAGAGSARPGRPPATLAAASAGLQSADDLYTGPFLDGLTVDEAPDFELWLLGERERLNGLAMRVLHALADDGRAEGDWRAVLAVAGRAVVRDPLQERMHQALMEAHAQLGERAAALRQYDSLRAILHTELGVLPLPATEALRAAIRGGNLLPPAGITAPLFIPSMVPAMADQPELGQPAVEPLPARERQRVFAMLEQGVHALTQQPSLAGGAALVVDGATLDRLTALIAWLRAHPPQPIAAPDGLTQ